jgi:hypothetical protein
MGSSKSVRKLWCDHAANIQTFISHKRTYPGCAVLIKQVEKCFSCSRIVHNWYCFFLKYLMLISEDVWACSLLCGKVVGLYCDKI